MGKSRPWLGAFAILLGSCSSAGSGFDTGTATGPAPAGTPAGDARRPVVILMIGDGMGPGQLEAASLYAHGAPGQLFMQSLPVHGQLATASLSGVTDSAAAATTMATGVRTWNARIGLDRDGRPVETLVELAHARGLAAGVVTTTSLPHATPAAFTAHRDSRHDYADIAADQVVTRAEVMLGGGAQFLEPHVPTLAAAGYTVVTTAAGLAAAAPGDRLLGLFAAEHLTYAGERTAATAEPTLPEMTLAALARLDRDPDGFFLVVEGGRIDMASHGNDLANTVGETLAFDDTVRAVATWAAGKGDVTILVTADHECGGLEVVTPRVGGTLPDVRWRWGMHTNARVDLFGAGPGAERFDDGVLDHAWVHAAARALLTGEPVVAPAPDLVPDGRFADLRHRATGQANPTEFGAGYNQLDALWLDADAHGLAAGIEGLFEWDANAVVLLVDVDFGAGTGLASLAGVLHDGTGRIDGILSASPLVAPPVAGFGADVAVVVWGGMDPHIEDLWADAGLRRLANPSDLGWVGAAVNFGEGVRARGAAAGRVPGEGLEVWMPWEALYPGLAEHVPPGATMAVAAVLVNDDGGFALNQALPPFPAGTSNPGRGSVPLPGVVVFTVDADGDGIGDGDLSPSVRP